jgi:hypothetical protein
MIPKGQPREMRRATLQFLRRPQDVNYFISLAVLNELSRCEPLLLSQIDEVVRAVMPEVLEISEEAEELAQFYIDSGILPAKKTDDALHVALSTIHEMDVLVSWNHRHIANVRKTEQYRGANLMRGYWKTPLILTPLEVLHV